MTVQIETSMKCGNCLNKIRPHLDRFPGVRSWEAKLSDPRKLLIIELEESAKPDNVVQLVRERGFEAKLVNDTSAQPAATNEPNAKRTIGFLTYKPLLLVLTYVIGATLFTQWTTKTWDWTQAMSHFMGFFFLAFAFFKLLDISKFADAFATYDIVAKRSRYYALAYPWIEVSLGLFFLTGTFLIAANLSTIVIMSVGLVGVVLAVRKKQAIQCACHGTAINLPMSKVTIIENSIMILMAFTAIVKACII